MLEEIKQFFKDNKIPAFRYKQLEDAVYKHYATSFEEITTYPKDLREKLDAKFKLTSLTLIEKRESDDTIKFVMRTHDDQYIESVLMMHSEGRRTVCVSSQIFCALGCKFCATGAQKKCKRNLTAQEIIDQVAFIANFLAKSNERVSNVVFMGMGEPFLNYNQLIAAIKILNDENYFGIGARHITVSTAGIVPRIREFADLGMQVRLAVSLHAPTNELRSYLMPVNDQYNIKELLDATDYFTEKTNKKVSFEYVLIGKINDKESDAKKLVDLLKRRMCHVNLLVYNPHQFSTFQKPEVQTVKAFKAVLEKGGIECSVRKSLGDEISGACGQLAGKQC